MRRGIIVALGTAAIFIVPGAGTAWADFVCPVLPVPTQAKDHSNASFITISGEDTSILPGKAGNKDLSPVDVPDGATNQDGTGSPEGDHATPGDSGYTAIWNT